MDLILDIKDEMSWIMAKEKIVALRKKSRQGWPNAYKQPRRNIITVSYNFVCIQQNP